MKINMYVYKSEYGIIFGRSTNYEPGQEHEVDKSNLESKYSCGDIRITQIIEVEFPEICQDEITNKQVQALDAIISKKEGEHFAEIQALKQRKQELLAITFQDSGNE